MADPRVGDPAPDFAAKLSTGEEFRLSELKGKKNVVLYFYPKDFTAGCTKEACYFRDYRRVFNEIDTEIIGVSRDSEDSHLKFSDKHDLNFPLISDPDDTLGKLYGAARFGGKLGVRRKTFVIGKDGLIKEIIHSETNMSVHAEKALKVLREGKG